MSIPRYEKSDWKFTWGEERESFERLNRGKLNITQNSTPSRLPLPLLFNNPLPLALGPTPPPRRKQKSLDGLSLAAATAGVCGP